MATEVASQAAPRRSGVRWGRIAAWLLVLGVSCGITYASLHRWEAVRHREEGLLSVPPVNFVRLGAAGYHNLLADIFYMRFTTYWGYWLTHGRKFHNMYPLLDLVTELDPHFKSAYEVGALSLADSGQVGKAVDLLLKGANVHPTEYWYPYQAGMMLFLYGDDFLLAAKYFEMAAKLPGAPHDAEFFAARMYLQGGQRELARDRWLQIYIRAARAHDGSRLAVASRSLLRYGIGQLERDVLDVYAEAPDLETKDLAAYALRKKGIDILAIDPDR